MKDSFAYRLRTLMTEKKLTGEQIAAKMDVSKSTVIHWSNGRRYPKDEHRLKELADVLGVSIIDLFPDSEKEKEKIAKEVSIIPDNSLKVRLLDGYVGAGSVGSVQSFKTVSDLYIDKNLFETGMIDRSFNALTVCGDSMTPYVDDGDIVIFYPFKEGEEAKTDGKYIIGTEGGLQVKNVSFRLNGDIEISSENKSYSPETIKPLDSQEYLKIVGEVVGRFKRG